MTSEQPPDRAPLTRDEARVYHRGSPDYSREVADWLVGGSARSVLELGAGTGRLTRQLVAAGHDVHATDAEPAMLEVLLEQLPRGARAPRTSTCRAEEPGVPDRSVDVVVCAESFHLFETEPALDAIARTLRPGGHLALVWHERDERIPWVRRLGRLLDGPDAERPPVHDQLVHSPLFSFVEEKTFKAWQDINAESVRDLVLCRPHVARLDPAAQEDRVAEVLDLYAEYGRGMDGMQLPHLVRCLRTQVVHQPGLFRTDDDPAASESAAEPEDGAVEAGPDVPADRSDRSDRSEAARRARSLETFRSDGTDTDMLLIDFR
ncbi:class I SAM-dependent methyltransferase [Nocardioides campestrisoli]|uniref:class I SAM-dependent methyltransferase n=1 Tax=Nocardioides campestrisoli TaxID=2736757 RepID=UPI00163DE388|nr:class I SAM-dependent methyltransferase [Nocardioides campestrisoli]